MHTPLLGLHRSAVQGSWSSQSRGANSHSPVSGLQLSFVHRSPSLQYFEVLTQPPSTVGLHSSVVQGFPSSQSLSSNLQ